MSSHPMMVVVGSDFCNGPYANPAFGNAVDTNSGVLVTARTSLGFVTGGRKTP